MQIETTLEEDDHDPSPPTPEDPPPPSDEENVPRSPLTVTEAYAAHAITKQRAAYAESKLTEAEAHKVDTAARLEAVQLNMHRARRAFEVDRDVAAFEAAEKLVKFARIDHESATDGVARAAKFLARATKAEDGAANAIEAAKRRVVCAEVERDRARFVELIGQAADLLVQMDPKLGATALGVLGIQYATRERVQRVLLERGMRPERFFGWIGQ